MTDHDNGIGKPIDRRCLMKLLALTGASSAVPTSWDALAQGASPAFEVENPKYLALYELEAPDVLRSPAFLDGVRFRPSFSRQPETRLNGGAAPKLTRRRLQLA